MRFALVSLLLLAACGSSSPPAAEPTPVAEASPPPASNEDRGAALIPKLVAIFEQLSAAVASVPAGDCPAVVAATRAVLDDNQAVVDELKVLTESNYRPSEEQTREWAPKAEAASKGYFDRAQPCMGSPELRAQLDRIATAKREDAGAEATP